MRKERKGLVNQKFMQVLQKWWIHQISQQLIKKRAEFTAEQRGKSRPGFICFHKQIKKPLPFTVITEDLQGTWWCNGFWLRRTEYSFYYGTGFQFPLPSSFVSLCIIFFSSFFFSFLIFAFIVFSFYFPLSLRSLYIPSLFTHWHFWRHLCTRTENLNG